MNTGVLHYLGTKTSVLECLHTTCALRLELLKYDVHQKSQLSKFDYFKVFQDHLDKLHAEMSEVMHIFRMVLQNDDLHTP